MLEGVDDRAAAYIMNWCYWNPKTKGCFIPFTDEVDNDVVCACLQCDIAENAASLEGGTSILGK